MDNNKNLILAVALSILVYVAWFKYIENRYGPATPPQTAAQDRPQAQPEPASGAAAPAAPTPSLSPAASTPPSRAGLDGALRYRIGTLELLVQPFGASIVSYQYPGPLGPVELVEDPHPGFFSTWPELRFERASGGTAWPAFEAVHPSGVRIRKQFLFKELDRIQNLRLTLSNPTKTARTLEPWSVNLGPGIGTVESEEKENSSVWRSIALLPPTEGRKQPRFEEYKLKKDLETVAQPWEWIGVHNRYFLAAIFPPAQRFANFTHGKVEKLVDRPSWTGGTKKSEIAHPWIGAAAKPLRLAPGEEVVIDVPFYFGPKGYNHLFALGHGLHKTVSFGWFHSIGRITLRVLNHFHTWTGNWGWSIIIMTLCLQAIMFPLTYKQTKSMAMMKKVQPELNKIQQKWKKDPQRMQREMMAVYSKHKVNPLSGCLPILVQMPIFIALFNMLRGSWELHGAPWIFWVTDLSSKDPFYVLPLVMGGIMFLQNKMNPQAGDPAQQKMMQYLPLIFTFMFLNFPAGLVLYWLTNSVLGYGQQIIIKRRLAL